MGTFRTLFSAGFGYFSASMTLGPERQVTSLFQPKWTLRPPVQWVIQLISGTQTPYNPHGSVQSGIREPQMAKMTSESRKMDVK